MGHWFAVVDSSGSIVSEGTEQPSTVGAGMSVVAIDGPGNGRQWDKATRSWGQACQVPDAAPGTRPIRARHDDVDAVRAIIMQCTDVVSLRGAILGLLDAMGFSDGSE